MFCPYCLQGIANAFLGVQHLLGQQHAPADYICKYLSSPCRSEENKVEEARLHFSNNLDQYTRTKDKARFDSLVMKLSTLPSISSNRKRMVMSPTGYKLLFCDDLVGEIIHLKGSLTDSIAKSEFQKFTMI